MLDTEKQDLLASIIPRGLEGDPVIGKYRAKMHAQKERIAEINQQSFLRKSADIELETIEEIFSGLRFGISRLLREYSFKRSAIPPHHDKVMMIVLPMDYYGMETAPSLDAGREIMRVYSEVGATLLDVAEELSELGASVFVHHPLGDLKEYHHILLSPHAVHAGLGERGRTGLFIDHTLGPLVRIGGISTDLDIPVSQPVVRGIEEFCKKCVYCISRCPVKALPEMTKLESLVKNVEVEFKINGERCIKYFSSHYGCGRCIFHCLLAKPTPEEVQKRIDRIETWYLRWEKPNLLEEEKMELVRALREKATSGSIS